jgi:hypothetical protein
MFYIRHTSGKSVTFEASVLAERKNPSIPDVLEISAKKIEDLCGAIGQTANHTIDSYSDSCIGILVDEDNGLFHRIWPSSTVPVCCADAISLNDLLVPGLLEKTVRLNLGVQLASAVMQLHTSTIIPKSA